MNARNILKIILLILIIVIVSGYILYQSRNLLIGPQVSITSPDNYSSTNEDFVIISGTTKNVSSVSINDRPIFIDTTGNFVDAIVLAPGYNIITVKAVGRFGKEIFETLELVFKAPKEIEAPESVETSENPEGAEDNEDTEKEETLEEVTNN
ncbi:hypothetical protein ACFLY0_00385 [Patescibacteria group bacterium]